MCYTETYVKPCGCRNQASGIFRCWDATSNYLPHCSRFTPRTYHDTTPCANQPSSGRSRSSSQSGGAFGSLMGAPSGMDRPRESSRSRLQFGGVFGSLMAASRNTNSRSRAPIQHYEPHASTSILARYALQAVQVQQSMGRSHQGGLPGSSRTHSSSRPP
jgi:hypothetical protein